MKKILSKTILAASLLSGLGLLFTGYAGFLNPNSWSWLSLAGYGFPVFLVLTVACLAVCALMKKRYLGIPFLFLLAAYQPVTLYCPVHLSGLTREAQFTDSTFTVMSYNTYNWARDHKGEYRNMHPNKIIEYIGSRPVDVVCLQESTYDEYASKEIDSILKKDYPYVDTIHGYSGTVAMIVSRYPIVRHQLIEYETKANTSGAFWINYKGQEIIVVSCHLQTMGFSMSDREEFGEMMHGQRSQRHEIKNTSRTIMGKILRATKKRAGQAEAVAEFLRSHSGERMIVCGDFNDIPQSYTYNTIISALDERGSLTDCFRQTAFGPGYSYSHFGMRARIDNILCSQHFEPRACTVDRSIDMSDHFPIISQLCLR
ncbi:MAG: endonuclease/exonuclease/phosphatase family protein [Prevotella sp.]|nr:endonuclease/exonuclease/phosphatase family protein [Prevotella sp.]